MQVEGAAPRAERPLSGIGSWISARMPFVWRTRMFLWIALASCANAVAIGYGLILDVHSVEFSSLEVIRTSLTGVRWVLYGLIFFIIVDTVRRTRPIVRLTHHAIVAGWIAAVVFAVSLPPLAFVRTLTPRVAAVLPSDPVPIRELLDLAARYIAGDQYESLSVTAALVTSLLAGLVAAVFCSGFAPDVLGLARGKWSLRRFRSTQGSRIDRWLAVRSPALWSSRVHKALIPILVPPATLALLTTLPAPHWILAYGSAALFIVCLFFSFRSQEAVRFLPLSWRAELGVFVIHCAVTFGTALVCVTVPPALDLSAATFSSNYPGNAIAIVLGSVFMASSMQAARNVSSIGVVAIMVALVSAFAGLGLMFTVLLGDDDAGLTVALLALPLIVLVAAAVSVRREMRSTFRRHLLSATLFIGPFPTFAFLIVVAPKNEDFTPFRGFVSVVLGVTGVALALYATRNPRRALAYTAR